MEPKPLKKVKNHCIQKYFSLKCFNHYLYPKINQTWTDGACTHCKCEAGRSANKPLHSCKVTDCDTRQQEKDEENFELEFLVNLGECCVGYKKVGCKVPSGGLVYKVGQIKFLGKVYFSLFCLF